MSSSDVSARASGRVLLLGLDGLGPAFLEAPIVKETMPNLLSLLRESATGVLASTLPPYTAPGWTSITTGMRPDRHGIFGFTDRAGRPLTGDRVLTPRVWDFVGASGGRSIVVNVPMTHPPTPIDGVLVSGMPVPPGASFTSPPGLVDELIPSDYVVDVPVREGAREPARALELLQRMTEARGRAVARLAREQPWDLFAVVFVLPDRLGHPWWKDLVPGDQRYESRKSRRLRRAAAGPLRALDEAIGGLLAALPPSTAVVTCSDHGFGPLRAEVFFDLVLAREGILDAPRVGRVRRSTMILGRSRASTFLPSGARTWAKKRLSARPSDGAERRAWTGPSYQSGVWLGDPSDEQLRTNVTDLLLALRDPEGEPLVRAVDSRGEASSVAMGAPDLLCDMVDGSVELHDGLHAATPWVSREDVAWGTHRTEGVVAIRGAGATERVDGEAPDITPTILALLGLEVPTLDGRSLISPSTPLAGLHTSTPTEAVRSSSAYSDEEEAAVLEHLRSLGYVE